MKSEAAIKAHYEKMFSSSPIDISEIDLKTLIDHDCKCRRCDKSIFEMLDFPEFINGEVWCEECHEEEFMSICDICEDWFEKATKPEDEVLIISKEAIEENNLGITPGFYQVKKWPYFLAATGFGFEMLFNDAIELIKEIDINAVKDKEYAHTKHEIMANECCHGCMEKYCI